MNKIVKKLNYICLYLQFNRGKAYSTNCDDFLFKNIVFISNAGNIIQLIWGEETNNRCIDVKCKFNLINKHSCILHYIFKMVK